MVSPFGEKKEVSVLFEACVCWSDRKPELLSVNSTCKIYQVYYLTEVTLSLLANRALPENFFMEACAVKGKVSID